MESTLGDFNKKNDFYKRKINRKINKKDNLYIVNYNKESIKNLIEENNEKTLFKFDNLLNKKIEKISEDYLMKNHFFSKENYKEINLNKERIKQKENDYFDNFENLNKNFQEENYFEINKDEGFPTIENSSLENSLIFSKTKFVFDENNLLY